MVMDNNKYIFMPIEDISTGIYAEMCNVSITNKGGWHTLTNTKNPKQKNFNEFTLWHYIRNKTMFDRFWEWEPEYNKKYH